MEEAYCDLVDVNVDSSTRREAAQRIGALRDEATTVDVERLVQQLTNTHDCDVGGGAISVRRAALLAFTELARGEGGDLPAAVAASTPAVAALLGHADPDAREMATRAMSVLGVHADASAVAALLEDEEADVRSAASDTLIALRDTLKEADITAIASPLVLASPPLEDEDVLVGVLQTLGGVGAAAAVQANHVATCMLSEEAAVAIRVAAVKAFTTLAQAKAGACAAHLPGLSKLLEDEEASLRAAAVDALGQLGEVSDFGDAISELLGDPDRVVRSAATAVLKRWELA